VESASCTLLSNPANISLSMMKTGRLRSVGFSAIKVMAFVLSISDFSASLRLRQVVERRLRAVSHPKVETINWIVSCDVGLGPNIDETGRGACGLERFKRLLAGVAVFQSVNCQHHLIFVLPRSRRTN